MTGLYLLGRKRAEARARQDMDALADRFEEVNAETIAEIRALRSELARSHAIDDALANEGIVSKRAGSFYKSGPSRNWLKPKNSDFARPRG